MWATLHKIEIGPSFIHWVKTFYAKLQSAVFVYQFVSDFLSLSRGVRQGCPLCSLLYVLVSEILASRLRVHSGI